jgi:hypothetical protein
MKTQYFPILARILVVLLFAVAASDLTSGAQPPERLKRADSFLGIHFDFHAGPDCTEIGKNTTPEMIENIIRLVQPDYLQIDCKGHRGLSSYPTRVGIQAPGFVGDPLRLWRQVTAERGVSLYVHYSGVWHSETIVLRSQLAVSPPRPSPRRAAARSPRHVLQLAKATWTAKCG